MDKARAVLRHGYGSFSKRLDGDDYPTKFVTMDTVPKDMSLWTPVKRTREAENRPNSPEQI